MDRIDSVQLTYTQSLIVDRPRKRIVRERGRKGKESRNMRNMRVPTFQYNNKQNNGEGRIEHVQQEGERKNGLLATRHENKHWLRTNSMYCEVQRDKR